MTKQVSSVVSATVHWVLDALFKDVALKLGALALAILVFVVTRDEVTRAFTIPLRVIEDPDRVLLSAPPDEIKAELRGPWVRINRLQDHDLGVATVDLRETRPGPMEIDPATLVMPTGVVLERLVYDPVDLRFEPVIERSLPVETALIGRPAPGHVLGPVQVDPARWTVRGGRTAVSGLRSLATEPLDVGGASVDVVRPRALLGPGPGVRFVRSGEDAPKVTVTVEIRDVIESRVVQVPVRAADPAQDVGELPAVQPVTVRGPLDSLETLFAPGQDVPLRAVARPMRADEATPDGELDTADPPARVRLTFEWDADVAPDRVVDVTLDPDELVLPYRPLSPPPGP